MTSVNTYTSVIRISNEYKYWSDLCKKIRNMQQSNCLKCFLTKTGESWWTKSADQKNWQLGYCCSTYLVVVDLTLCTQYVCCQFFELRFQAIKTPVFVRKHFRQSLCSIFLIFSQRFDQALIFANEIVMEWTSVLNIIRSLTYITFTVADVHRWVPLQLL